jgi:hypothetical protein
MKVLYKNKVGVLAPLTGTNCADCIFCPSSLVLSSCVSKGLTHLCVNTETNDVYKFTTSQSDLLTYEN